MDKYEQEIFEFLTIRENYEAMLKVNSHFEMVCEELLTQFWDLVAGKIKQQINTLQGNWDVLNPDNKAKPDSQVIIYKKEWKQSTDYPLVGFAWEHLFTDNFYGIWCDTGSTLIDYQKFRAALNPLKESESLRQTGDTWWIMWDYGRYNFLKQFNITHILPDRAAGTADEYASLLTQLLPKAGKLIDNVLNSSK